MKDFINAISKIEIVLSIDARIKKKD